MINLMLAPRPTPTLAPNAADDPAGAVRLVEVVENPVPEGARVLSVLTDDGVRLRVALWRPAKARGTVVLVQGRAEFIEKYHETVRDLLARGFAVVAFDLRGQGGSQRVLPKRPRKGHVRSFADYETDLDAVMRQVVLPDCPAPVVLIGHSTGGAVALGAALKGRTRFDRLILLSPFLGFGDYGLSQAMLCRLARGMRWLGRGRSFVPGGGATATGTAPFKDNPVTSDKARYQRAVAVLTAAPELAIGSPTIGWIHAACQAFRRFDSPEFAERIRVPALMMIGGAETIVSTPACEGMAERIPAASLIRIPGARHELLMERDIVRAQVFAAFDAFVPERLREPWEDNSAG